MLLVHSSFRAVRPVEGGPEGLIAALSEALGPDGTLVMPGWGDGRAAFDPVRTPVASSLGIVPATFAALPGVLRSDHVHAFLARGPRAAEILRDPLPLPPHRRESPVGRVYDADGSVLLLGVNHDADTTVHLAELEAGAPYRVPKSCVVVRNGVPTTIAYGENDHCCRRFVLVDDWVREVGTQREGLVGSAHARLVPSRDVVEAVVPRVRVDPLVFLCEPQAGCVECDEARASVASS
ncbi:MAG: AAC(3) family N-acetyltransferase [Longimicrobiales bacterium]